MRWFLATTLLLVAIPANAQENDAEKLFRAMEKKIVAAKSLKVVFETDDEGFIFNQKIKLKGSGQFTDGNKVRLEMQGNAGGEEPKWLVVSDGKQVAVTGDYGPGRAWGQHPTPARFNAAGSVIIARLGLSMTALQMGKIAADGGMDAEKELPISAFKLGAKERIRNRETQIIEYTVLLDGKKDGPKVKLWIDSETMLPLKRYVQKERNKERVFTETYTEFVLDAQLDAKLFDLPK